MVEENEDRMRPELGYLLRIVLGLILLGVGVLAAFTLVQVETAAVRWLALAALLLAALAVTPLVGHFYRRSDEFHQSLHQRACIAAMPVLFSLFAGVGVLQVNQLLPPFNGFWAMGMVLVVWALNLMLSDRQFRG